VWHASLNSKLSASKPSSKEIMDNDIRAYLLPILVLVCIAVVVTENIFAFRWTPFYYRSGIVVYRRYYKLPISPPLEIKEERMNKRFHSSFIPSIIFKKIGKGEYAFREKLFQLCLLTYTPIMKGHIVITPEDQSVTIKGHLDWFSMILPPCMLIIVGLASGPFWWFVGVIALILVSLYLIQYYRFNKIGDFLQSMLLESNLK